MQRYLLNIILLTCLVSKSFGGEQVRPQAQLDTTEALIGDWVELTLQIRHPDNQLVQWPLLTDSINGLEIIKRSPVDTQKQDNQMVQTQKYTLTGFDSGRYTIPALLFIRKTKTATDTFQTSPLHLTIHTVPVDTSGSIRSIKAPLSVPLSFAELWPYLLAVVGVILLGLLVWYAIRKLKQKQQPKKVKPKPSIPPHKIALRELKKLEEEKRWQHGETKEHYVRLTTIIRKYIEQRFRVKALELTTKETIDNVKQGTSLERSLVKKLERTLETADFAKFAKFEPSPEENKKLMKATYDFVRATKPQPSTQKETAKEHDA